MNFGIDLAYDKVQGYRAYTGNDKNMLELRDYWALPKPAEEKERLNKIYEILK